MRRRREPTVEFYQRVYEIGEGWYEVDLEVRTYCIREGNYSCVASDPDEYYGEYVTQWDIMDAAYYANEEADGVVEETVPDWVINEIEYEFGEYR